MSEEKSVQIGFRFPAETVGRVDAYAEKISKEFQHRINRTTAIERLINIGLASEKERFDQKEADQKLIANMEEYGFDESEEDNYFKWDIGSSLILRDKNIERNSEPWFQAKKELSKREIREDVIKRYYQVD